MALYKDFVLYEGNHLHEGDFFFMADIETAAGRVNSRFKETARAILNETKPGDLVLLEAPIEGIKGRDASDTLAHKRKISNADALRLAKAMNFYARLAAFARRYGRKVESIDSGTNKSFTSKAYKLDDTITQPIAVEERELLTWKRNKLMCSRIERLKPKMVIVAQGHAAFIENHFHPAKVISTTPEILRPGIARKSIKMAAEQKFLQQARRAKINARLGLDKPKTRPVHWHKP